MVERKRVYKNNIQELQFSASLKPRSLRSKQQATHPAGCTYYRYDLQYFNVHILIPYRRRPFTGTACALWGHILLMRLAPVDLWVIATCSQNYCGNG